MTIDTKRLYLREMTPKDYPSLCKILQDAEVMYAYEHAFDDDEAQQWLDKQLKRYEEHGFGLWAVVLKESGEMIGQCGLTMQDCNGRQVPEVGYLFQKAFWHNGYACEAAIACKQYAFEQMNFDEVFSIIRDNNLPSQAVARRNGMVVTDKLVKHYHGVDMPHLVFSVKRHDAGMVISRDNKQLLLSFWLDVAAQDAARLAGYFADDAVVNWHNTNESFTVPEYITANCEYPGNWQGFVERIEESGSTAITVTRVWLADGSVSVHATSFFELEGGRITRLDEYWGDDGEVPQWRKNKALGRRITP